MAVLVHPQSELIREPRLLVPGRQPLGPVRVDTSHFAGKYCSVCIMPVGADLIDIISGIKLSTIGTAWSSQISSANRVARVADALHYKTLTAGKDFLGSVGSYIFIQKKTDSTSRASSPFGAIVGGDTATAVYAHFPYSNGTAYAYWGSGSEIGGTPPGAATDRRSWAYSGGAHGRHLCCNNTIVASSASAVSRTTGTADITINKYSFVNGDLYDFELFAVFKNLQLSPSALLDLTRDPYQFLIPA